jgi:hypothetical protein
MKNVITLAIITASFSGSVLAVNQDGSTTTLNFNHNVEETCEAVITGDNAVIGDVNPDGSYVGNESAINIQMSSNYTTNFTLSAGTFSSSTMTGDKANYQFSYLGGGWLTGLFHPVMSTDNTYIDNTGKASIAIRFASAVSKSNESPMVGDNDISITYTVNCNH